MKRCRDEKGICSRFQRPSAVGGTIPLGEKSNLYLKARYYDEFGAKNRLEGEVWLFTATVNF
jgi:hypothetical protein